MFRAETAAPATLHRNGGIADEDDFRRADGVASRAPSASASASAGAGRSASPRTKAVRKPGHSCIAYLVSGPAILHGAESTPPGLNNIGAMKLRRGFAHPFALASPHGERGRLSRARRRRLRPARLQVLERRDAARAAPALPHARQTAEGREGHRAQRRVDRPRHRRQRRAVHPARVRRASCSAPANCSTRRSISSCCPTASATANPPSPATACARNFPQYGYTDMVEAQYRLLTEGLGVNHLRLVMGTSMGGMHTWLWGERHPEFMDALMPLASLPTQISGRNRVWRKTLIDAIRNDPAWNGGNYTTQPPSLRTAAALIFFMGSNPVLRQEQMPTLAKADEALDAIARQRAARPGRERRAVPDRALRGTTTRAGPREDPRAAARGQFRRRPDQSARARHPRARDQARAARRGRRDPARARETRGHGSHTIAALWKQHLAKLLAR